VIGLKSRLSCDDAFHVSNAGSTPPGRRPLLPSTDADFSLLVTAEGETLAASRTVEDVLGWDINQRVDEGLWAFVVNEIQRVAMRQLLRQTVATGSARMTLQVPAKLGLLWVDAAAKLLEDEPGSPVYITARDVSHDWAMASQLSASELQWRVAFEHSPIGGALLDDSGSILVVNEALCRMTDWRVHELTRMNIRDVVDEHGTPWQEWWDALLLGGSSQADRMVRRGTDEHFYGRLTAATITSPGSSARIVMQVEDITSRREAELELANRALNDGLTGAPNRFLTRQWLASALEDHPGGGVGVLYCDLDRFKIINDSLGHPAGDDLLVKVVERLRGPLRPEDLLGRVGGDEFVVIIEGVQTPAELNTIAARLADALAEPFDLAGHRHAVTLSIGGTIGAHPDTADDVLMRADMALLRAKRLGRARYVAFDPVHDRIATRADLQLEDDLRMSLEAGELRAYYQPIVALEDINIVGYEALVRWQHPEHGLLPPARFLELAEISGLIRPLGWWMLEQACTDASNGGVLGGNWIAVNASAGQLTRPGVATAVMEALTASGLPPERLHLEITETALLTATESLSRELRELSGIGVKIALDDFGTGYSSLSLLRQFPVDVLKIDRSFIAPLLEDRSAYAIVKAMVGMCADMGVATVAEGIETSAQSDALRQMGCSHGQGYLFGHAEPLATRQPRVLPNQLPKQAWPGTRTEIRA
jgi:diguanylate cyclase (GGDEF)-like protein/PAS domain S-box-containing protein